MPLTRSELVHHIIQTCTLQKPYRKARVARMADIIIDMFTEYNKISSIQLKPEELDILLDIEFMRSFTANSKYDLFVRSSVRYFVDDMTAVDLDHHDFPLLKEALLSYKEELIDTLSATTR